MLHQDPDLWQFLLWVTVINACSQRRNHVSHRSYKLY
ncbi:hypothetical protein GGP66_003522 [Salinibacter ruber]|nr:hypothetical protein [Salinibacter ruber]